METPTPSLPPVLVAEQLAALLGQPGLRVVDCRFDLDDPGHGALAFSYSRIPGACRVDLERQLSAPVVPGRTGRHPLPSVSDLEAVLGTLGIGPDTRVVIYDDFEGGFAARLWWLLRWLGHREVAVLDGGWSAWADPGFPLERGPALPVEPQRFCASPIASMVAGVDEVMARLNDPELCLVDARSPARYRGEQEPRDPVAGRIPGARNAFWRDNLDEDGRFLAPARLRERFLAVLEGQDAGRSVHYCGSGVTGAHNVLAMTRAGLSTPRLYPGSWSEWIVDPSRPVRRGVAAPGGSRGSRV